MLPELQLSEKFEIEADKAYLDLLVGIFVSSVKANHHYFTYANKVWYLREIALLIRKIWPALDEAQYQSIMDSIVEMVKTTPGHRRVIDYTSQNIKEQQ